MKNLKYCEHYQNVMQRHKVSKRCQESDTDRLACIKRVARNLQFVKKKKKEKKKKLHNACLRAIRENTIQLGAPV